MSAALSIGSDTPMDNRTESADVPVRGYYQKVASGSSRADYAPAYVRVIGVGVTPLEWIPVEVQMHGDSVFATDAYTRRTGMGATTSEALADLRDVLLQYLRVLQTHRGRMSPMMERHLKTLQQFVRLT